MRTDYEAIKKIVPDAREQASMDEYTSFRCGGKADLLVFPADEQELSDVLSYIRDHDVPYYILGNGSNILVKDGGFHGVIVAIGEAFAAVEAGEEPGTIRAGSAVLLSRLAAFAQEHSLTGLEFAGGIPGSVGGAVYMNAGAYGGEIKDVLESVRLLPLTGGPAHEVPAEDLELGYRHSRLMEEGAVVLSAVFRLAPGDRAAIDGTMADLTKRRQDKQPLQYASAGSFFKRPPGYYAGRLVEDAGCKGLTVGDAQISPKHAGFLINRGHATATDILTLMHLVQARVLEQSGVLLEPEVRIIGDD